MEHQPKFRPIREEKFADVLDAIKRLSADRQPGSRDAGRRKRYQK